MKKILYFAAAMLLLTGCKDNSGLSGLLTDYDRRIAELEQLCMEMNTNISSMQTIINVYESGDVITNISPLVQNGEEVGYIITFSNHESIVIYHGKNGNEGAAGAKGEDGRTPNIGVKQDTDGIYYWTLNGEWLLGDKGEKLPVSGTDGAKGEQGESGAQGDKGADGITPQLKIEDGYWFVSTDNGLTWTNLGKATGEDGAKGDKGDTGATGSQGEKGDTGAKGDKGDTGDSMFRSVTQGDDYVYFTLTDGTIIKIAKGGNGSNAGSGNVKIVDGAIQAAFSVSPTKKVYFSQGNLQYQASTNTWRFAEHQWDYIGEDNLNMFATYDGWIDLFAWGTSGYDEQLPPYCNNLSPYAVYGYNNGYGIIKKSIANTNYDWGVYCAISNGGNQEGLWRTLTLEEWKYLINQRPNATALKGVVQINGILGLVLLPDDFTAMFYPSTYGGYYTIMNLSLNVVSTLESYGAIFFPVDGYIYRSSINPSAYKSDNNTRKYWLSTHDISTTYKADVIELIKYSGSSYNGYSISYSSEWDCNGHSVRLVQDVVE